MEDRLLHLGCMIYNRFPDYEISAKAVLSALGIKARDMQQFACCSSTIVPSFSDEWIYLASYNLALAEKQNLDIVTLCGTCTATFKRANYELSRDKALLEKVNSRLEEVGLSYSGKTQVNHILEVLVERLEDLKKVVKNKLSLKVALQHPCNVFRPGYIANFDNPFEPQAMRKILQLTGVEIVDYPEEYQCCGSTLTMLDESLGAHAGAEKLISAQRAGADFISVACGNCAFLFNRKLEDIKKVEPEVNIKTLFITQILALAMGLEDRAALDIRGVVVE